MPGLAHLELVAKAGYGFRFRRDHGGLIEPGPNRVPLLLIQARLGRGGLSGWILRALCPTLRRKLLRYGYLGRRLGYGFDYVVAKEVS
ncbi:MAG: hypothetical protein USCGTAYLOR_03029 [Chromatiales bacterium USCg_Taylor]|nr:MAG: hypothetical protein USCGTAYLOR_03029 [Chromatiales bacterium USCg_Taylor]